MSRTHTRANFLVRTLLSLVLVAPMLLMTSSANAYTFTGCKWQSASRTWAPGGGLTTTKVANSLRPAVNSWNVTDVTLTEFPASSLTAVGYASSSDGLNGKAEWTCASNGYFTTAIAAVNRTTTANYPLNKVRVVWVHEFGHALGLGHTSSIAVMTGNSTSWLYDTYGIYTPQLDDRNGMNARY